jgi:hypothetical protein
MYIFSATTTRESERLQTQFGFEGGVNDGLVEKICLSGEERFSDYPGSLRKRLSEGATTSSRNSGNFTHFHRCIYGNLSLQ